MCVQALISIREYTGEHRSVGDEALPVLLLNNVCVCEAKFKGAEAAVQTARQ